MLIASARCKSASSLDSSPWPGVAGTAASVSPPLMVERDDCQKFWNSLTSLSLLPRPLLFHGDPEGKSELGIIVGVHPELKATATCACDARTTAVLSLREYCATQCDVY